MGYRLWTGSHSKHRLLFHLVFLPKYRKRVLSGKIAKLLQHEIYEGVKLNGWWVEELAILEDHVHMLIQIHANESIASVVKRIKGATSRALRKEYEDIPEFVWGDHFWARGYFAESIGSKTELAVKKYIQENNERNATVAEHDTTDFSR
jgi:putative transposase